MKTKTKTERIRYLGPLGTASPNHSETGGKEYTFTRGKTVDCPYVELAQRLKKEQPKQFDDGTPNAAPIAETGVK